MAGQAAFKTTPVGVDLVNFAPGFIIGGVVIDNPTLSWLSLQAFGTNFFIPPLTLGFSTPLSVFTKSVTVKFVNAPFSGVSSVASGNPVNVTVFERLDDGSTVVSSSPGTPIIPAGSQQLRFEATQSYTGPFSIVTGLLGSPGPGLRTRLFSASMILNIPATIAGFGFRDGLMIGGTLQDSAANNYLGLCVTTEQPTDNVSFPVGITWPANETVSCSFNANMGGNITIIIYYATEQV